jgi:hypothetical protein
MRTSQPKSYLLPSESFFVLAASADVFVVADDVQFSTNGSTNRSRLKTVSGAHWLTIPVLSKGRGMQKLNDVEIDNTRPWQRQHWRTLEFNYHNAPYFGELADTLAELYQRPYQKLTEVSWAFLQLIWKSLRWENLPHRTSELGITSSGEQRLADLASRLHADVYLAHEKYSTIIQSDRLPKVELRFVELQLPPYHQSFGGFVGGLNILDLLFNEGIAFTKERLQKLAHGVRAHVNA